MKHDYERECDLTIQRFTIENKEKWRESIDHMPTFVFPPHWGIQIIAPFGGAFVRFRVWVGKASVSVYYDPLCRLGGMTQPYWEIYPDISDDNARFFLPEDQDEMQAAIEASLKKQLEGGSNGP